MTEIETLDRSTFMISFAYDLRTDVYGRHNYKSNVEFKRHGEEGTDVTLKIVLMMSIPT